MTWECSAKCLEQSICFSRGSAGAGRKCPRPQTQCLDYRIDESPRRHSFARRTVQWLAHSWRPPHHEVHMLYWSVYAALCEAYSHGLYETFAVFGLTQILWKLLAHTLTHFTVRRTFAVHNQRIVHHHQNLVRDEISCISRMLKLNPLKSHPLTLKTITKRA